MKLLEKKQMISVSIKTIPTNINCNHFNDKNNSFLLSTWSMINGDQVPLRFMLLSVFTLRSII